MMTTRMEYVKKDSHSIDTVTLSVNVDAASEMAALALKHDPTLLRINIVPETDGEDTLYYVAYPEDAKPVAIHMDNPVALKVMDIDDDEQLILKIADNYLAEAFEIIDYEDNDGDFIRGIAIGNDFIPMNEFISTDSPWVAGKMKGGK